MLVKLQIFNKKILKKIDSSIVYILKALSSIQNIIAYPWM